MEHCFESYSTYQKYSVYQRARTAADVNSVDAPVGKENTLLAILQLDKEKLHFSFAGKVPFQLCGCVCVSVNEMKKSN